MLKALVLALAAALPAKQPDPELYCLTATVYGEARGESEIGQALVAQTVLNRARAQRWPEGVCAVVSQRHQFSGFRAAFPKTPQDYDAWRLSEALSEAVRAGNFRVGSCGRATHFHEASITPAWSRSLRRLCRVDSHIFYEEK